MYSELWLALVPWVSLRHLDAGLGSCEGWAPKVVVILLSMGYSLPGPCPSATVALFWGTA